MLPGILILLAHTAVVHELPTTYSRPTLTDQRMNVGCHSKVKVLAFGSEEKYLVCLVMNET